MTEMRPIRQYFQFVAAEHLLGSSVGHTPPMSDLVHGTGTQTQLPLLIYGLNNNL
jgi:hypothetical protein